MIKSKVLNESAWKDVLAKNKSIKDNGLLKSLGEIKKLDDDDFDGAEKRLDEVVKLAGQLKKAKEVSASKDVTKFIAELTAAAETALRDVAKDKAEAQKTAKVAAAADAKKRDAEEKGGGEEEEESELLTSKMIPLFRAVKRGERMFTLIAHAGGKQCVVLLARKPIVHSRRPLLAKELGVTGGVKYLSGHCVNQHGSITFVLDKEVSGMAKKLKLALLTQTGMRVNKLKCLDEEGGTDADEEDGDDDETAVAEGDDEGGGEESASGDADGGGKGAAEAPPAALAEAPATWNSTRDLVQSRVEALKDEVRARVGDVGGALVGQIDGQLGKLDRILEKLDQRLGKSLALAGQPGDAAGRAEALKQSKVILTEYIRYVSSEPLIDHLDKNPFGVKTELKATLSKSLTQLAQAIS